IEIVETMFETILPKSCSPYPYQMILFPVELIDIAEDVEQQLFGKGLRDKFFSIQLDEATDSTKDAHFIAYVRFWMVCQR
ncbi:hypothetical protein TNCV_904511, partial [Trichonephila clavipes]